MRTRKTPKLTDVRTIAERLGITPRAVQYRCGYRGIKPTQVIGGTWLFDSKARKRLEAKR